MPAFDTVVRTMKVHWAGGHRRPTIRIILTRWQLTTSWTVDLSEPSLVATTYLLGVDLTRTTPFWRHRLVTMRPFDLIVAVGIITQNAYRLAWVKSFPRVLGLIWNIWSRTRPQMIFEDVNYRQIFGLFTEQAKTGCQKRSAMNGN